MLVVLSNVQLFVTLWIIVPQALLSTDFSRQEYWNQLPCPPGDLITKDHVVSHSYEMPNTGIYRDRRQIRVVMTRYGEGWRRWGAKGCRVLLQVIKMSWKLDSGNSCTQLCEYTKAHYIVSFKINGEFHGI